MRSLRILALVLATGCILSTCGNRNSGASEETQGPETPFDTLAIDSYGAFIQSDGLKIVEFGGKHCAPCNRMRERLIALQKEIPTLKLGLVFWEDNPELFDEWGVTYIPAQIVYNAQGAETARHVGEWEIDEMKRAVEPGTP